MPSIFFPNGKQILSLSIQILLLLPFLLRLEVDIFKNKNDNDNDKGTGDKTRLPDNSPVLFFVLHFYLTNMGICNKTIEVNKMINEIPIKHWFKQLKWKR